MRVFARTLLSGLAIVVMTAALGIWSPVSADAHSSCAVRWGSLPQAGPDSTLSAAPITDVRAGRHACFDRLVIDVAGSVTDSYDVRYAPAVLSQGAGDVVPLRGGAFLDVVVRAPVYEPETGAVTYQPRNRGELVDVRGFRTFRQLAFGGSFEGYTTLGLGVRARLPFRVFVLPGTTSGTQRLVVDVAHRW